MKRSRWRAPPWQRRQPFEATDGVRRDQIELGDCGAQGEHGPALGQQIVGRAHNFVNYYRRPPIELGEQGIKARQLARRA